MKLTILVVGRLKERYLEEGINDYLKRLRRYMPVELVRVREEPKPNRDAEAAARQKEAEQLLGRITPEDYLVALSEEGLSLDSPRWARHFEQWLHSGRHRLVLVIGSGAGLAPLLKERADQLLSLSPLTFPHQLALLLLLEQLYRGWTILRGEPYHR